MITLETDAITEKQLAQLALEIQNRWEVPAFVKMHEIVVMDEDGDLPKGCIPADDFKKGIGTIFENLEMDRAFHLEQTGRTKYFIERVENSVLPRWMAEIEAPQAVPDDVFECPHCGVRFATDIELSLHTKLHYII